MIDYRLKSPSKYNRELMFCRNISTDLFVEWVFSEFLFWAFGFNTCSHRTAAVSDRISVITKFDQFSISCVRSWKCRIYLKCCLITQKTVHCSKSIFQRCDNVFGGCFVSLAKNGNHWKKKITSTQAHDNEFNDSM